MAYNLLKGKRGIIFGALNELSIAWKVAERAHEEGAKIVLTNTPVSIRLGTISTLAEQCGQRIPSTVSVLSVFLAKSPIIFLLIFYFL